jgi:transposase
MPKGRPVKPIRLSKEQEEKLRLIERRLSSQQSLALRAKVILECAQGKSNLEVAKELGVCQHMVGKWRRRFIEQSLEGLVDAPRSGAPREISDEKVEEVVTKTLETTPAARTHWSSWLMAKEAGISQDSVRRIWQAFGLKPHLVKSFKLSTDPMFVEKVRDIVGLYLYPPQKAIVLCVDEKSQTQALERTQPILPMKPGYPERQSHDYYRHGVVSLFSAYEVATGRVIGKCHSRHREEEFLKFMQRIDTKFPGSAPIHLVLDNLATHKTPRVRNWLPADLDTFCILPLRAAPGLIRSNAGLPKSLLKPFAVAIFVPLDISSKPSTTILPSTTRTQNPSSGPPQPRASSPT